MEQKRRKHNAKELFMRIDKILEEKGLKPDILDYGIGDDASQEILAETFDIIPRVNFGGCEGIYLDIRLEDPSGQSFGNGKKAIILGTYKTLCKKKEDYVAMSILGAEFVFALNEFVWEHEDEFNWTGYDVSLYADGNPAGKIWVLRDEAARKRARDFLTNHPSGEVRIRDNKSGKEFPFLMSA